MNSAEKLVAELDQLTPDTPYTGFIGSESLTEEEKRLSFRRAVHSHTEHLRQNAEALGDNAAALVALGPEAIPAMQKTLRTGNINRKMQAILVLGELDHPASTDALLEAYVIESATLTRSLLAQALARRDDPRIPIAFLRHIHDAASADPTTPRNRNFLESARTIAQVMAGNLPGADIPFAEIEYVGEKRLQEAVPDLITLLSRSHSTIGSQPLVVALGKLGDPAALPVLENLQASLRAGNTKPLAFSPNFLKTVEETIESLRNQASRAIEPM